MQILGTEIDQFDHFVCNSFRAKIFNNQLCYEIDLNKEKKYFSDETLKRGLTFLVDENKERSFSWINRNYSEDTTGRISRVCGPF